jgi:hypothetical protein
MRPHDDECTGCNARLPERLDRNARIDRKSRLLERLGLGREVELEDAFTSHVADAIRASSPTERQQAIDKATEAYEAALDEALYELLDERFAEEDSSVASRRSAALRQPWVGSTAKPRSATHAHS